MRSRSKLWVAVGLSCLTSGALAGGALAHGGGKNKTGLELQVRGLVTAVTAESPTAPGTITVSPAGLPVPGAPASTLTPWTCTLRPGTDVSTIVANTTFVKMKCRSRNGVLTAKRVRTTLNTTGKVQLEASGLVTAFTAFTPAPAPVTPPAPGTPPVPGTNGLITIDAGVGTPVTCAVTERTRVRTAPVVGTDTAKIECKTKNGVLVAKKVKVKHPKPAPMYGGGDHHKGGDN